MEWSVKKGVFKAYATMDVTTNFSSANIDFDNCEAIPEWNDRADELLVILQSEAGLTAIQTGADQQAADVVPDRQNTSPMQPSPGGPSGAMSGIETQRADGVQQEG